MIPAPLTWFESAAAHDLGRVLLHTLWQAPLAAAALWGALKTLPAARARLRSAAAGLALVAVVVAAVVTHAAITLPMLRDANAAPSLSDLAAPPAPSLAPSGTDVPSVVGPPGQMFATPPPIPWTALALTAWAGVATLLLLNTLRSVIATRRLTRGPGVAPVEPWAQEVLQDLQKRLRIRRADRLLTSAAAHTPCVLGALFPVIVLPPALAAQLTPDQLRVVLAHELAHIRRHDYLVNLLQHLVESLLFFNPAVWWISRQLRLEREAACDAIAARALDDDRVHVARTLVDILQQLAPVPTPNTAMALGQPQRERPLTTRIQRLLHPHLPDAVRLPWPTLLLALSLTAAALYGVACGSENAAVAIDRIVNPDKYIADTRRAVAENAAPEDYRYPGGEVPPADRVTVSGTVVAHDHADLTGRTTSLLLTGGGTSSASLRTDPDDPHRLRFTHAWRPGAARILIRVAGYGPVLSEPLTFGPGETRDDLHFTLPPGRDLPVRVTDHQGQPIAGVRFAHIAATVRHRGGSGGHHLRIGDPVTDGDGRMVIPDTGPVTYRGRIQHPGFEVTESEITPGPGDVWGITLQPALPVRGVVTSAATGLPLPGGRIRLAWDSVTNAQNDPRTSNVAPLATTDAEGRFTLTSLARHARHTLWVEADGHAPTILRGVAPRGDAPPIHVELSAVLRPRFRVEGPLELLKTDRKGVPRVQLNQTVQFRENFSYTKLFFATADPEGDGRTFTFDAPLIDHAEENTVTAGTTVLRLNDLRLLANQPQTLNLTPEEDEPARRSVIIKLNPPAGWPAPEGTAEVTYRVSASDPYRTVTRVPITDGAVRFEVLLNTPDGVRQPPGFALESVAAPGYWLPAPVNHADRQTEVTPAPEPLILERQIQPAGLVTGRVVDNAGHPLADATLHLRIIDQPPHGNLDSNNVMNFRADAEGRFALFPAPFGGTYLVSAASSSLGRYAGVRTAPFIVDSAHPKKELDVTIPRGTDVALTVLNPAGIPLANVPVDVHRSQNRAGGGALTWSPGEHTDTNGVALLSGIDLAAPDATWSVAIGQVENYRPARMTLDQPALSITLQPGATVTGRVIDADTDAPVPDLTLKAVMPLDQREPGAGWNEDGINATTGADGSFTLRGLTPGQRYQVRFNSGDAAEETSIRRDTAGKITGTTLDGTRFTAPTTPDAEIDPLTLRVVVNPWNH